MTAILFSVSNAVFFVLALWLAKWFERDHQKLRAIASYGLAGVLGGLSVLALIDAINYAMAM